MMMMLRMISNKRSFETASSAIEEKVKTGVVMLNMGGPSHPEGSLKIWSYFSF